MTVLRSIVLAAVLLLGSGAAGATIARAEEHDKDEIKILREAAAALSTSHPELSRELTKYADKEAKEERDDKEHEKAEHAKRKEQAERAHKKP